MIQFQVHPWVVISPAGAVLPEPVSPHVHVQFQIHVVGSPEAGGAGAEAGSEGVAAEGSAAVAVGGGVSAGAGAVSPAGAASVVGAAAEAVAGAGDAGAGVVAVADWDTGPVSPGLPMRIETAMLVAPGAEFWGWGAVGVLGAGAVACAEVAAATASPTSVEIVWSSEPSFPALPTRTDTATFAAAACAAATRAAGSTGCGGGSLASASAGAAWPSAAAAASVAQTIPARVMVVLPRRSHP